MIDALLVLLLIIGWTLVWAAVAHAVLGRPWTCKDSNCPCKKEIR